MDPNRLSRGEQILGVTSLVLIILSLIPGWAKVEFEGLAGEVSESFNAWGGSNDIPLYDPYGITLSLAFILALACLVLVVIRAVGARVNMPLPWGLVYLALAGLAALLMLLNTLIGPDEVEGAGEAGVEISRGILLFLGLALTLGMAAGAFLHYSSGETETTTTATPGAAGPPPTRPPGT